MTFYHFEILNNKYSRKMAEDGNQTGIIEAKLKGPGPGRYKLPSTCGHNLHDYTQHRKPAYTFGKNLGFSYISKVKNKTKIFFFLKKKTFGYFEIENFNL